MDADHAYENVSSHMDSEDDLYYFESDHLALKDNRDYQNLLKTVALLEAQKTKAIKEIDTLAEIQQKALQDPILFVEKLQRGEDCGIPRRQEIAEIPLIHWERYTSDIDPLVLGLHKHHTRTKKHTIEHFSASVSEEIPEDQASTSSSSEVLIRGRKVKEEEGKSATFNKLWTVEEQQRLEELLIKYPPEEVESKRWHKIAKALGNRTMHQVSSRIQKYFIKLAKAGLPVPGRMPNLLHINRGKKQGHAHHRYHRFYYQPSTFMQKYDPPVYMSDNDDDDIDSYYGGSSSTSQLGMYEQYQSYTMNDEDIDVSDDESIPPELRDSEEYLELMNLKMYKKKKMQESCGSMQHIGYKCDCCKCEPIVGVRFHCVDCPLDASIDLCDTCIDSNFETLAHGIGHRMEPIKEALGTNTVDKDYGYKKFMAEEAYVGLPDEVLRWYGIDPMQEEMNLPNQKCVTKHPDFDAHINQGVLQTFFLTHRRNWKKFPKPRGPHGTLTNGQYRLVAYRHILEWFLRGEVLGEKNRIPLPSCIVLAIRKKYPAPDGEYTGFQWVE